jgi:hypothetical protein
MKVLRQAGFLVMRKKSQLRKQKQVEFYHFIPLSFDTTRYCWVEER